MTHCVVYRTGGRENFRWHRSERCSEGDAIRKAEDLRRMGYPAHVVNYTQSVSIGLPETFEPGPARRRCC